MNPFDEFDPHHRVSGKKTFIHTLRAANSKINLQTAVANDDLFVYKKPVINVSVKKEVIDAFEFQYA